MNPRAGHETSLKILPVEQGREQTLAVVGAGPAGDYCTHSGFADHPVIM